MTAELEVIGRNESLFTRDVMKYERELVEVVRKNKFLVIGGAGSIGRSVTFEIFKRNPKVLDVIDISENNLVELVRGLRSSIGYSDGVFRTFVIDTGSLEFKSFLNRQNEYDYVLNLSALKHVRSERDPYTLMRMIMVNIINNIDCIKTLKRKNLKNYFCVSTDKATNPFNLMGASKKVMEMFLLNESKTQKITTARFANVAFSDGSLLHGFNQRFLNKHPLSVPSDIKRYFISSQEAGELCLLSCILGENRDNFFPIMYEHDHALDFVEIATKFLESRNYKPIICSNEEEARNISEKLIAKKEWPINVFKSDTTGEKPLEEFFDRSENINLKKFDNIGIIENKPFGETEKLAKFRQRITSLRSSGEWQKEDLVEIFEETIDGFEHKEKNKNLDQRM